MASTSALGYQPSSSPYMSQQSSQNSLSNSPLPSPGLSNPRDEPRDGRWKSVFKFSNSSRKYAVGSGVEGRPVSTLTLDTATASAHSQHPGLSTGGTSRSSYQSSATHSSIDDADLDLGSENPTLSYHPNTSPSSPSTDRFLPRRVNSTNALVSASATSTATPSKKYRKLGIGLGRKSHNNLNSKDPTSDTLLHPRSASQTHDSQRANKAKTAVPSQTSFTVTPPNQQRSSKGLAFPKFIRRVASAPNAKGLFSSSRAHSSGTDLRKNGLLAAPVVPPLPGVVQGNSSLEGTDSLETMSSGSSRSGVTGSPAATSSGKPSGSKGRSLLSSPSSKSTSFSSSKDRKGTAKGGLGVDMHGTSTRISNSNPDGPGKVAFRRTYSSNSIKVREVCSCRFYLARDINWTAFQGRGHPVKFPQGQNDREGRCG